MHILSEKNIIPEEILKTIIKKVYKRQYKKEFKKNCLDIPTKTIILYTCPHRLSG